MIQTLSLMARRVVPPLVLGLLAACGGGGGGGGDSPTTEAPSAPTGLVPAAPALGDLLADRAVALRPLKHGAASTFTDQVQPVRYEVKLQWATAADGRFTQTRTETSREAPEVSTVWHDASGQVRITQAVALSPAKSLTVDAIELPSTLRQGGQWTLLDRRIDDVGIDVDGDGRTDAADVAAWSRVIGTEPLDWAAHLKPADTVRVDTWLAMRAVLRTGGAAPVVVRRMSTWYLKDVGVVRTVVYGEDDATPLSDEVLVGYDAIDSGFGHVIREPQYLPQDPGTFFVGMQDGLSVALSDSLLSFGSYNDRAAMIRFDLGGRLQSVVPHGDLGAGLAQALLAFGDEALLVTRTPAPGLVLWPVDRLGNLGPDPVATLDFAATDANVGDPLVVHERGQDRFWVVHTVVSGIGGAGGASQRIDIRAYDRGGRQLLQTSMPVSVFAADVAPSAIGSGLAVTWSDIERSTSQFRHHYLRLDQAGAIVSQRVYDLMSTTAATAVDDFRAIGRAGDQWLVWRGPSLASPTEQSPHAWRIDERGDVLAGDATQDGALAATVGSVVLSGDPTAWPGPLVADGDRWFALNVSGAPLYPGNTVQFGSHMQLVEYDAGAASPADVRRLRRIELPFPNTGFAHSGPIVLADRVVVFGRDAFANKVMAIVWR